MENMQQVLDLITMIFDTIRKYILLVLGRENEIEGEVASFPWEKYRTSLTAQNKTDVFRGNNSPQNTSVFSFNLHKDLLFPRENG